jgi:hypothetical protein
MTYHRFFNKINNTTGFTSKAGTPYPPEAHEFSPSFLCGLCCSIFSFIVFYRSLFVSFLLLDILSFVLRHSIVCPSAYALITPLISSIFFSLFSFLFMPLYRLSVFSIQLLSILFGIFWMLWISMNLREAWLFNMEVSTHHSKWKVDFQDTNIMVNINVVSMVIIVYTYI